MKDKRKRLKGWLVAQDMLFLIQPAGSVKFALCDATTSDNELNL